MSWVTRSRVATGSSTQPVSLTAHSTAMTIAASSPAASNIQLVAPPVDENLTVVADADRLQQVVWNLLSNAIKFTPEGGRVLLKVETDLSYLVLIVSDTGVGIAPEEQELVFEKFRQSGNPLTREHAGTGLGLSIVRELSKLLGGEVTLQSELGRGSTFTVRLPQQLSEEPRLEFDLAHEGIDLSKAQRVDVRLYAGTGTTTTRLEAGESKVDAKMP